MTNDDMRRGEVPVEFFFDDDDDEPVDEDIALITDYLARELNAEQAAAVEHRLVTDMAFYMKVGPLIKIWRMKLKFRDLMAEAKAEEEAQAERAKAEAEGTKAGASRKSVGGATEVVAETAPRTGAPGRVSEPARRWGARSRRSPAHTIAGVGLGLAIAGATFVVARIVTRGGGPVVLRGPDGAPANGLEGNLLRIPFPGRARTMRLGDSTFVHQVAGSRFLKIEPSTDSVMFAALQGEAYIEVSAGDKMLYVATTSGVVKLRPGAYAVRCVKGSLDLYVTVGRGQATLRGGDGTSDVTLGAGEFGHVARGAAPERTVGGAGYPALEPPKKVAP